MAVDPAQQGHVVTVVGQEGAAALVALPMVGFPDGFQLTPGARVVLVTRPSGPAVRPLVRAIRTAEVPADPLQEGAELALGGGPKVLQEATVVDEQPAVGAERPGENVVWVVESAGAEGPEQVIAVRRATPRRP